MRRQKGFTLIELLIVVAIIGIIAAIAIPNLLNAINRGRQKRSMADMRTIGTAIEEYAVDYSFYPKNATEGDLATYIEPTYLKHMPRNDGWNNAFDISIDSTGSSYTITSYGRNGGSDTVYSAGTQTRSFDDDIVFSNGSFHQWPEGVQN